MKQHVCLVQAAYQKCWSIPQTEATLINRITKCSLLKKQNKTKQKTNSNNNKATLWGPPETLLLPLEAAAEYLCSDKQCLEAISQSRFVSALCNESFINYCLNKVSDNHVPKHMSSV